MLSRRFPHTNAVTPIDVITNAIPESKSVRLHLDSTRSTQPIRVMSRPPFQGALSEFWSDSLRAQIRYAVSGGISIPYENSSLWSHASNSSLNDDPNANSAKKAKTAHRAGTPNLWWTVVTSPREAGLCPDQRSLSPVFSITYRTSPTRSVTLENFLFPFGQSVATKSLQAAFNVAGLLSRSTPWR